MSHASATLTPRTRLRLACLIVEQGWTYAAAAKMFMVAPKTARKWAGRYRNEGVAGMAHDDRVLRGDHPGDAAVHHVVVPLSEEPVGVLGHPIQGQQPAHHNERTGSATGLPVMECGARAATAWYPYAH